MLLPFFDGNIMLIDVKGNVLENEIRNIFTPLLYITEDQLIIT